MNLFKALSYKEWIKTRRTLGILLLLALLVVAYIFIDITHEIRIDNAVNVWFGYLFMEYNLPLASMVFPSAAGPSLALVQFIPEMVNNRLKLTMHLPSNETAIIASMLLYGYLALTFLFLLLITVLALGMSTIVSREISGQMFAQLLPWLVAGLSSYGFTAWICFEPQWKQRILNMVIALGLLSILFISPISGIYLKFGLGMLVILFASFTFPFYSALRFKHGVQ